MELDIEEERAWHRPMWPVNPVKCCMWCIRGINMLCRYMSSDFTSQAACRAPGAKCNCSCWYDTVSLRLRLKCVWRHSHRNAGQTQNIPTHYGFSNPGSYCLITVPVFPPSLRPSWPPAEELDGEDGEMVVGFCVKKAQSTQDAQSTQNPLGDSVTDSPGEPANHHWLTSAFTLLL